MTRPTRALTSVLLALLLPLAALAQRATDPAPIPIAPNVPLITATPTLDPNVCLPPLPIQIGQTIFIRPGVNLRNLPTQSGGIVWNTIYNNLTQDGQPADRLVNVPARVTEGPVCSGSLNWWRVTGLDAPGWVAEGRPDQHGYFLIVPGQVEVGCASTHPLQPGTTADLLLNVRVRAEANENALVKTVAPAGTPVEVLRGGECVGGLRWWFVRVTVVNVTYEGWMSEGDGERFWLVPRGLPGAADGTQCGVPLPLASGSRAVVNTRGVGQAIALRSAPDRDAPLLFSLVDNVPLVIEGAPVCSDGLNWWPVRVETSQPARGWIAEGSHSAGYTLRILRTEGEFRYDQTLPDATSTSAAPLPNQPLQTPGSRAG